MERNTHGRLPSEILDCQKKRIFFLQPFSKHFWRERAQSQNLGERILLAQSFQDSPNQDWILSPTSLFPVHFNSPTPTRSPQIHPLHTQPSARLQMRSHTVSHRTCTSTHPTKTHTGVYAPMWVLIPHCLLEAWMICLNPALENQVLSPSRDDV